MKKFLVTCMALCSAFCFSSCFGGGDDSSSEVLGIPLTVEDEQKIEVVVDQIDYVLEAMPDLDDLMGATATAVATGDVDTLRSMQKTFVSAAKTDENKSVTFSFDIDVDMDMGAIEEDMKMSGFFKITDDALYAEYTKSQMCIEMSNITMTTNMPFKLYIDAEEVYLYYEAYTITMVQDGKVDTISSEGSNFVGRWIDLDDGYVSNDLAASFEQLYQSIADGMRASLKTMKSFFDENVADKMSNVDGVYTVKADWIDDYYRAYAAESGDTMQGVDTSSGYTITGDVKIDVSNPAKTVLTEKVSVEMEDLSELAPELAELLGNLSYKADIVDSYAFYDINATTIEKPTDVGPWNLNN